MSTPGGIELNKNCNIHRYIKDISSYCINFHHKDEKNYTLSIIRRNRLIRMHTIFARLEDDIMDAVSHNNLNRLVVDLRNRR